jgi:hypothetical protein
MAVSKASRAWQVTRSGLSRGWTSRAGGALPPLIGGQRQGGFEGADALVEDVCSAHGVVAAEGLQRRATCEWGCVEGRPALEKVTKEDGLRLRKPWENRRKIVLQGTGEAVGAAHVVVDHAATRCDELCAGAHRGALRLEGPQRVTLGKQQFALECSGCGGVFGATRRAGVAIPGQRQGMEGKEDQKVIRAQGGDKRPFVACEADGKRLARAPRAAPADPRVDGLGRVLQHAGRALRRARGLKADSMLGIGPVDPKKGRKVVVYDMRHVIPPSMGESGEQGQAC